MVMGMISTGTITVVTVTEETGVTSCLQAEVTPVCVLQTVCGYS